MKISCINIFPAYKIEFKISLSCLCCSLFFTCINAQRIEKDSLFSTVSAKTAASYYESQLKAGSVIFSGTQYLSYSHGIKGTPFLVSEDLSKGTVSYDDVVFNDRLINYDAVKDEVITKDYSEDYFMQLIKSKVSSFTIYNRFFVRIDNPGKNIDENGFFEQIITGEASFYIKRKKILRQAIATEDTSSFVEKDAYYIQYKNNFYPITNTKSLYAVVPYNRNMVRNFLSSRKDDFKKDPEGTIAAFCNYLNLGRN